PEPEFHVTGAEEGAQYVTPPSTAPPAPSTPPTPPATDEGFAQAKSILAHLEDLQSGLRTLCAEQTWIQFQLVEGEFDELLRCLERDPGLNSYVHDKIRYAVLDEKCRGNMFIVRAGVTTTLRRGSLLF